MKQYLACFLTFVALSTPVSSATFSEPPDFATRTADAISVGSLDLGTNTASGALDGACADPGTDLQCNQTSALDGQDTILFTIDAGLQLASIEVSFDSGGSGPLGFVLSSSLLAADRSLLEFNEQTFGETKTLGTSGPWGRGSIFSTPTDGLLTKRVIGTLRGQRASRWKKFHLRSRCLRAACFC
jgi:hypothetical protein